MFSGTHFEIKDVKKNKGLLLNKRQGKNTYVNIITGASLTPLTNGTSKALELIKTKQLFSKQILKKIVS